MSFRDVSINTFMNKIYLLKKSKFSKRFKKSLNLKKFSFKKKKIIKPNILIAILICVGKLLIVSLIK